MTDPINPPAMSACTRRLLDEATARDRALIVVTGGYTLADIRSLLAQSTDEEREALAADGLKWRHYWRAHNTAWRQEVEDRQRAKLNTQVSHDLAVTCRWGSAVGPTHRELARLRSEPAWVNTCARVGCLWQETVYDKTEKTYLCPEHRLTVVTGGRSAA